MVDRKATICLLSLAATFIVVVSVAPQTRALAITRVNVIDVVDGRIVPNSTVTIRGKMIASVAQNSAPPGDAQIVDGQGKFVIPGLWDMHAHMEMTGESWLQLYVANGVTGIRDMGSALDLIVNLREGTSSGRTLGPQIVAAGPILDDAPADWPFRMRVRNPDEGRAAVQLLKRRGVDLIKVHNYTPRDVFFAIADEARQQKLPVAGHVPLKATIQDGVDAGMVSIEHLSEDGLPVIGTPASAISRDQMAYVNKRFLEMHAGNQSVFLKQPEVVGILKNLAEVGKVVTRDMAAAGVGILAGCDAMIAGFCVHDELAAM